VTKVHFFLTFLSWFFFLSLFTYSNSWVARTFSSFSGYSVFSNFFCLAAFLSMFFSGLSFLLYNFFTLPYYSLYFAVSFPFSLVSSFRYFLLILLILFQPPTTLFQHSIYCSICNSSLLLLRSYNKHTLFPCIVQSVLPNSYTSWATYRCK